MKKWCIVLLLLLFACCAQAENTIMVATDLHYLAPELTDHGAYFMKMIESADGKVMAYSEELLEAFTEQMIQKKPDALIVSGDLTFNGEKWSHLALAEKLERMENAGVEVLVLPGNHDLYNEAAARFKGSGYSLTFEITAEEFAEIYAQFGYRDAISRDTVSLSYVYPLAEGWRVLMVDANARYWPNYIRPETLAWAETQLQAAAAAGERVLAVSHQNLHNHSSLLTAGFTIDNAAELRALYEKYGVALNLSGHVHMQHVAQGTTTDIATSSLAVYPNQYGVMKLHEDSIMYTTEATDVSSWARKMGKTDENLLDFAAYSRAFFMDTAYRQAFSTTNDEQMAHFFAELNTGYFSGRPDQVQSDEEAREKWLKQPSFFMYYIQSMLEEKTKNHTQAQIGY